MIEENLPQDSKAVFGWVMYDFANSAFTTLIVTFVYATYFTKAIAPDELVGTALWSRAMTASALMVAILSPLFGALADRGHNRKGYLFGFTLLTVIASALLYLPLPGQTGFALALFVVGNTAFELACVFYNAYLPDLAPSRKIGQLSGLGWAVGYAGGLGAMFLAMVVLVNPQTPWFGFTRELGQNIRATNLLVAIWFALFSLPMFFLVREPRPSSRRPAGRHPLTALTEVIAALSEVGKYRQVARFLLARLLYNDGLNTIFAFGGIYAAGTFAFSFQEIMTFGLVLNITAGLGAFAFGYGDDRWGGKRTVLFSLVGLTLAALLAVLTTNKALFWLAGIMVGLFSGPNQSASRSLLARFTPPEKEGEFFGFFAFSGKFAAFLGPLLFGLCTSLFASQRAGVATVILFFVGGGLILSTVDEGEGIRMSQRGFSSLPADGGQ